jgi:medium-chain acyl-[acyl-carrier-protein] hydrolase
MTTPAKRDPWITYAQPNPRARLRLFCLPYAGGGATIFRTWPDALPPEVAIFPVQLPGRENRLREPPFTGMLPLVQTLAQVLRPYLTMPFALFGHSMGALMSFELARQLRRAQHPLPRHVFVSGFRAPQLPDPDPPIHALPEAEFIAELRRLNGTPEEVLQNAELMQLVLPALRADFAILETYAYAREAPLECPITVFGGLDDDEMPAEQLAAWREQTRGAFRLHLFPGDHFFIHSARTALLETLSQELAQLLRMDLQGGFQQGQG